MTGVDTAYRCIAMSRRNARERYSFTSWTRSARLGHNGLGIDLRTERPRPASIRAAVRRVLVDPTFAANVASLRAELDSDDPMSRIEAALREELLTTQR
jgi:UDP:flavonoid glycosyltransferase YjiC (YdhE family)